MKGSYSFFIGFFLTSIFFIRSTHAEETSKLGAHNPLPKEYTLLLYMVNNNDLNKFSQANIDQILRIGSTPFINILVQRDDVGAKTATRFYMQQGQAVSDPFCCHEGLSGTPENLFDFMSWGVASYPARHYILIIWNHGSGIKDEAIWGRGIAYNEVTKQYINNQDLKNVMDKVRIELLDGRKLDMLCCDACCMQMLEVATSLRDSVDIVVASENIEPGQGYNYEMVLKPFLAGAPRVLQFACHVVDMYAQYYGSLFHSFTHSAIIIKDIDQLEQNVHAVAHDLCSLTKYPAFLRAVRTIRQSPMTTTEFFDKDFIDLMHFYRELRLVCDVASKVKKFKRGRKRGFLCFNNYQRTLNRLKSNLERGMVFFKGICLHNLSGYNYPRATGLSIYFPQFDIEPSYLRTDFAQTTEWVDFLRNYQKPTIN